MMSEKKLKVALVNDFLVQDGGAERVLRYLPKCIPKPQSIH